MPSSFPVPIGLSLNQAARTVERAFDEALAEAGGTLPVWLILLNLKIGKPGNQRELAEAVGIRQATLTHHLSAMEDRDLVTRRRDASNRRVQQVELTEEGEAVFLRLREAAMAFDARLRQGLSAADLDRLGTMLGTLSANAAGVSGTTEAPPWAGLAEPSPRRKPLRHQHQCRSSLTGSRPPGIAGRPATAEGAGHPSASACRATQPSPKPAIAAAADALASG